MSAPTPIIVITNKKEKLMSKEIRNFLLIYIAPICFISLFFVFFAPALYSVVILGMIVSVALMVMAFAFVVDWLDK
jgi:hypothetical protein